MKISNKISLKNASWSFDKNVLELAKILKN